MSATGFNTLNGSFLRVFNIFFRTFFDKNKNVVLATENFVMPKVPGHEFFICIMLANGFKLVVFPCSPAKFHCPYPQGFQDLP